MPWAEFKQLLSGIAPDTPLGRIVSIRSEDNKDILKHFTKEQHHIRNKWRIRVAKEVNQEELDRALEDFKQAFLTMAGGGK